jgi:mRNA interferase RelE/StbE
MEGVPSLKDKRKIAEKIRGLAENPRPTGSVKLSGEEKYRLRHRHFRVVYSIDDEDRMIRIVKIAQRKAANRG